MKPPKMLIFDYGETLLCEQDYSTLRGNAALLHYVTKNPHNMTAAEIDILAKEFSSTTRAVRGQIEISSTCFRRLLFDYLNIEFSISPTEQDSVFFENCSTCSKTPHVEKMLDYLETVGIRTGVISNCSTSENVLKNRIRSLLPNHSLEFVITSSTYGIRKPHKLLFELALHRANLEASDVWYCGNDKHCDVEGSANCNIFPVWYNNGTTMQDEPACKHLKISDWNELIEVIGSLL